ncbi:hypothetical protein DPEC_G00165180 [Dallia pectoralis]|uniref:Uncharacterized protein n=1 Tax=Dallia pectoralis TaxID=75939 RepID=A0ACC2GHV3_DALPE|nr:hypothetical protein DPEC_G00165180 [Dallia pectoralis]
MLPNRYSVSSTEINHIHNSECRVKTVDFIIRKTVSLRSCRVKDERLSQTLLDSPSGSQLIKMKQGLKKWILIVFG